MGNAFTSTTATGGASATGYYSTQARVEAKYGAENVKLWSNKDNTTAATDTACVQAALTWADGQIDSFFRDGPYTVPLTPLEETVRSWGDDLTAWYLYTSRGLREDQPKDQALQGIRAGVVAQMALYKANALRLACQRRWPTPNSPVAVG